MMDPEVPQALRLQAILVGGIVIVHAKQQVYLLEDAQDTLVSRPGWASGRKRKTVGKATGLS